MVHFSSRSVVGWVTGTLAIAALAAAAWLVAQRPTSPTVAMAQPLAMQDEPPTATEEPLVAPPKEEVRTSSAEPEQEPTPVLETKPEGIPAAVAWLQRVLPDRYGTLTTQELAGLEELDLRAAPLTDADLALLAPLTNLRILGLRGTPVTDAGLAHLSGLALTSLDLRGTAVTSFGMARLPSTTLEALHLTDSKVLGTELYRLPRMPNLAVLKLNRLEQLDDASIESLGSFPNLRHVELDGTHVSDQGLRRLLELNPDLKRIELRGVPVSEEALSELRTQHPGCELVQEEPNTMRMVTR